jgi:hypothetical protein
VNASGSASRDQSNLHFEFSIFFVLMNGIPHSFLCWVKWLGVQKIQDNGQTTPDRMDIVVFACAFGKYRGKITWLPSFSVLGSFRENGKKTRRTALFVQYRQSLKLNN